MKKFVVALTLLLNTLLAFGQEQTAYREQIAIHLNATEFLVGERVLMTVYCLDVSSRQPSSLSSIAYLELIGEDMKPVLQSKMILRNGVGGGHLILPNHLNSGNYTLIAYTRWMRNFPEKKFFRKELTIINPHRLDPNILTTEIQQIHKIPASSPTSMTLLKANLDKEQYGLREHVTLSLTSKDSLTIRFSIGVRAIEDDNFFNRAPESDTTVNQEESLGMKGFQFLPDLRGELITGTVLEKSTQLPFKESLVSLSVPAKDFQFLISRTDSSGRFYFNIPAVESTQLFFAVPGKDINDFTFKVDNPFLESYSSFMPSRFWLEAKHLEVVERRFIHQQIDNSFGAVKRDSIVVKQGDQHFYGIPEKRYELDLFTRFPTMEDIFREIIPEVIVKKRGDTFALELYNFKQGFKFDGPPLILIDGILVEDAAVVMAYDPTLIKQISVRNSRHYYGGMSCNGILSIETFLGEAKGLNRENLEIMEYVPSVQSASFFSPIYDQKINLSRIPDYRIQLFWDAEVIMKGVDTKEFSFFTSDIPGKYLIEMRGVKSNGELIYQSKVFHVLDKKEN